MQVTIQGIKPHAYDFSKLTHDIVYLHSKVKHWFFRKGEINLSCFSRASIFTISPAVYCLVVGGGEVAVLLCILSHIILSLMTDDSSVAGGMNYKPRRFDWFVT